MNGGSAVVKEINGGDAVARSNADAAQGKNRDTAAVSYATVHRARSLSRRAGLSTFAVRRAGAALITLLVGLFTAPSSRRGQ